MIYHLRIMCVRTDAVRNYLIVYVRYQSVDFMNNKMKFK